MSSYLSNLLTQTTSRYNTLRRTLLSNEDDGDTEDDSHISRVLRAYYTEKGRPFPPWLPPDPNDRRAITPQPYAQPQQQGGQYFANVGQGGRSQHSGVQAQHQAGNRGSLSDLWDPAPAAQPSSNGPTQPQSLRAGRRPVAPAQPSSNTLAPPQARPLPSQRAGSYQSVQSQHNSRPSMEPSPPSSSGGGSTAQERLKARLWGGARGGSSNSVSTLGSMGASERSSGGNAYDTGGGSGGRRYGREG
ncbi:hypothetical protein LTR36_000412 [Oleoguttula mirabilis]|uniref:Mso1 N-terminal domain-containing protein n=1 Tax=Oleoguttula mirabilis TaxID=1507867 RepID=A0AAV9K058_9PEZI|nr:hypothetical protein LTR36_000412 [Oleoguttula mirabilis]